MDKHLRKLTMAASVAAMMAGVPASHAEDRVVAYVKGYTGDEYYTTQECGVLEAAEKAGVKATISGAAEWDAGKQSTVLRAVIQTKPDVIIIDATDSRAMIAPIQSASEAGIPVMTVGDDIEAEIPFTFLAANQFRGGEMAADRMIGKLPSGGKLLVVGVKPGISSTDQRQQGFERRIADNKRFQYLGVQYTDNDQNKAAAVVSATLQAHPDLAGIFAVNLITAQGAAAALRQAGVADKVELVGFDASPTLANSLRDGTIDALISQNPRELGVAAVADAVAYLDGKRDFPRRRELDPFMLSADNLDTPEGKAAQYVASCD
ncbi:ABC transporter substrate-binding protein [Mesorhizobium sp. CN2-181]|uniref:ABC transporter substrate-binding protein n=1 Tax=Mesorhizobium yinganensis TaxID=3157707 RepID=UPI0032B72F39